jgi:hypothetical protein
MVGDQPKQRLLVEWGTLCPSHMTSLRKFSYTYLKTRDNDFQNPKSLRHLLKNKQEFF